VALELGDQLPAPGGPLERAGDDGPLDRELGGEHFLHQPDALDEGESAAAPGLAPLKIPDS
jgi:hypothetical protein